MVPAEDLYRKQFIKFQRLATRASAVVDTAGSETAVVRVVRGALSAGGAKARLYGSDTVSGTASGMTLIASAGTSLAASGSSYGWILHQPARFLGLVLSAATTASGIVGAECDLHDNKAIPPHATNGFTAVARVPSGA